ncbi:MAG: hypothetical protein AB7F31_01105 [Parachlamydiales bacterium]
MDRTRLPVAKLLDWTKPAVRESLLYLPGALNCLTPESVARKGEFPPVYTLSDYQQANKRGKDPFEDANYRASLCLMIVGWVGLIVAGIGRLAAWNSAGPNWIASTTGGAGSFGAAYFLWVDRRTLMDSRLIAYYENKP